MGSSTERLHALAAMAQAAQLSLLLSHTGICSSKQFATQIKSLFVLDPSSFHSIYGSKEDLHLGLLFAGQLATSPWKNFNSNAGKLIQSFLYLARKLTTNKPLQEKLRVQLKRIEEQAFYFESIEHSRVINNLADLFLEAANQYKLGVRMIGKKEFLQNPELIAKIRALLFSGLRAAVLWYQMGGSIIRFLLERPFILQEVQQLARSK